jgi:hypothetical protein
VGRPCGALRIAGRASRGCHDSRTARALTRAAMVPDCWVISRPFAARRPCRRKTYWSASRNRRAASRRRCARGLPPRIRASDWRRSPVGEPRSRPGAYSVRRTSGALTLAQGGRRRYGAPRIDHRPLWLRASIQWFAARQAVWS